MYTELDRSRWGWDEYTAYAKVGVTCFEDDFDEEYGVEEYSDYNQDDQPSWYKFVKYVEDK